MTARPPLPPRLHGTELPCTESQFSSQFRVCSPPHTDFPLGCTSMVLGAAEPKQQKVQPSTSMLTNMQPGHWSESAPRTRRTRKHCTTAAFAVHSLGHAFTNHNQADETRSTNRRACSTFMGQPPHLPHLPHAECTPLLLCCLLLSGSRLNDSDWG